MDNTDQPTNDAAAVAERLAAALQAAGQPYALGGAIALGYWGTPRGTLDVDVTVFLPPERPAECLWLLQDLGCEMDTASATANLRDSGYCQVTWEGLRVDVFLPTIPFYEAARLRRREVRLGTHTVSIWDAESLAVFKMMFFRRKDLADVEQILRSRGPELDRAWIRQHLVEIYGYRDPRIAQWDELAEEIPAPPA